MLRPRPRIFALVALALVAGCAGSTTLPLSAGKEAALDEGLSRSASSMSGDRVVPNSRAKGALVFRLTIPTLGGGSNGESYISPATRGMLIVLTGPTNVDEAFALGNGAQGCKVTSGKVNCKVSIAGLKNGSYTALVNLYDQPPNPFPTGNLLSTVPNAPFTIVHRRTTNFAPTLAGVPASIAVTGLPTSCTTFGPTAFTVTVSDPDSNAIVGAYSTAIALSDSDLSGNTTLATSGPDNPPADQLLSSLDTATIAWNGTPVGNVTISAQAGSVSGSGTFGAGIPPSSQTFSFTGGGSQNFVVPLCATSVYVVAAGASGAGSFPSVGGTAAGTIPTTPGETLDVVVGGASTGRQGGANGGGDGTGSYSTLPTGGGGASDVRQGGINIHNRVVVGGGGGGLGNPSSYGTNGTGGVYPATPAIPEKTASANPRSVAAEERRTRAAPAAPARPKHRDSFTEAAREHQARASRVAAVVVGTAAAAATTAAAAEAPATSNRRRPTCR